MESVDKIQKMCSCKGTASHKTGLKLSSFISRSFIITSLFISRIPHER